MRLLAVVLIILLLAAGTFFSIGYDSSSATKIIGISGWGSNPEFSRCIAGFKTGLAENGFVEGDNLRFILENSETDLEVQRRIIESFVKERADLIFSLTTPGTLIAKEVTQTIPIVFSVVTYPVESGVIHSLESSGNNLVGTRNYVPLSRQFFTFEMLFPHTRTLGIVRHKGEPNSTAQRHELASLLERRGIALLDMPSVDLHAIRNQLVENIDKVDAIFSPCDTLTHAGGEEIIVEFSKAYGKPSFACNKEGVLKGHLIGNVGDFYSIGKISGEKAAYILKGAKPTWLETESPRGDYIVINLATARVLDIEVPQDLMRSAKEIIEE
jgi:putative ABC transport system substrate-binding protein